MENKLDTVILYWIYVSAFSFCWGCVIAYMDITSKNLIYVCKIKETISAQYQWQSKTTKSTCFLLVSFIPLGDAVDNCRFD